MPKPPPRKFWCVDVDTCYTLAFETAEDLQRAANDAEAQGRYSDHDVLIRMRDVAAWIAHAVQHGPDEATAHYPIRRWQNGSKKKNRRWTDPKA